MVGNFISLSCALCLLSVMNVKTAPPPKHPPEGILEQLTQHGQIPLEHYYVDDSNRGKGTHYKYRYEDITEMIAQARNFIEKALSVPLPAPPTYLSSSSMWPTQLTDMWFVHALNKYTLLGENVVVYGSTSPWYESLVLGMGASHVTVVEYNHLTYSHPNISTLLVEEMEDNYNHTQFDMAVSLSSFDHDGLGRYGDPINPDADFNAMQTVKRFLKPGGLLFLTVPIGPDVVVWNLHRRYGRVRLPHLLHGWEEVECVGWREEMLDKQNPYTLAYEPVFVLRPIEEHSQKS